MEQQPNPTIFEFGIDEFTTQHLISIAKWNKFLSITAIIGYSLGILFVIFGGATIFRTLSTLSTRNNDMAIYSSGLFTGVFFLYALIFAVLLIPNFFRLNFSNKMLKALDTRDQNLLNESFGHLKTYSKYWGILTIIGIGFYAIMFIIILMSALFAK